MTVSARFTIYDVASATGLSPRRGEIRTTCPICGGGNPTAVSVRDWEGRAVAHCFKADHASGALLEAIVGRGSIPMPERPARVSDAARPGPLPVDVGRWWHYCDADTRPAFSVQRIDTEDGKTFRQWTPSDDPNLWYPRGPRGERPMYRLPEVLKSDGPVYIPEGEKCADVVAVALNAIATTFAGGAANWQNTDWSPLAGRSVVLLADDDDVGRTAMRGLGARLMSLGCQVLTAEPEDGAGDVADWFDQGGASLVAQQLDALLTDLWLEAEDLSAWQRAVAQGFTDGKEPLPDGILWLNEGEIPKPEDYQPLSRTGYECENTTWGKYQLALWSNGTQVSSPIPCDECGPCLRYWMDGKILRLEKGLRGSGEQSLVIIDGCLSAEDAQRHASAIGRMLVAPRVVALRVSDGGQVRLVIVYREALPPDVMRRIERRIARYGLVGQVYNGPVNPATLREWVDGRHRIDGKNPLRFVGWVKELKPLPEYECDDGDVVEAADVPLEAISREDCLAGDTELTLIRDRPDDLPEVAAKKLEERAWAHVRRWLAGVELDADRLLDLRDGRLKHPLGVICGGEYLGPRALLRDLANVLDDDACINAATARPCMVLAAMHIVGGGV